MSIVVVRKGYQYEENLLSNTDVDTLSYMSDSFFKMAKDKIAIFDLICHRYVSYKEVPINLH